jgi:hypothetical protein
MSLFGKRLKKFAVVSSILAAFGGAMYYVVMSIADAFKEVDFDFSEEEDDDYQI